MQNVWAEQVLTNAGWQCDVQIVIADDGTIASITPNAPANGKRCGVILPALSNVHSHALQRAMAGMTEKRGPDPRDTFWTWRKMMFRFLDQLTPDDLEAITSFAQMEMLEAGFAAVGEFHYVHHQPGGVPYDDVAEIAARVVAASAQTGIGLTLLPVLYEHGGCDGRPLSPGQIRFGNHPDQYEKLFVASQALLTHLPPDAKIGVAPHSLRAVSQAGLSAAVHLAPNAPLHMHLAEQVAEVDEVQAAWGQRPVEWLLDHHHVDARWCLIHLTQMQAHETRAIAQSGAVAGLCPQTESSLGDGIFDGVDYLAQGGRFGIGSDSNIRIAVSDELRTLEYSQRLRDKGRAMLATPTASTGRRLYQAAASGGAQAIGRRAGGIEIGQLADLVALDSILPDLQGKTGDDILDSWIFVLGDKAITDVWSAGRHLVTEGLHLQHAQITRRYCETISALRERI